jgi:pimeloyl-ACP methyl ester carboxylesterase
MRFVLVHGGAHGAWCWDKTVAALERLGHEAHAVDLPGHGTRAAEKATLDGYRDAVVQVLRDGDILVGHSMGGHVISTAADAARVRLGHLVYLAAGVPIQGKSMTDATPHPDLGITAFYRVVEGAHGAQFEFTSFEAARQYLFHDCSEEDARWAYSRLTPQQFLPVTTPITLDRFWQLSTPRSFILCTDDRSLPAHFVEGFMTRLKLHSAYPIWASHSPYISRPDLTAQMLVRIGHG